MAARHFLFGQAIALRHLKRCVLNNWGSVDIAPRGKSEEGWKLRCRRQSWMLSGPCELLSEENQARSRKGLEPLGQTSPDWSYLLTEAQRSYLARYTELAAAPNDCVFDLTWNPLHRHSKGNLLATHPPDWFLPHVEPASKALAFRQ